MIFLDIHGEQNDVVGLLLWNTATTTHSLRRSVFYTRNYAKTHKSLYNRVSSHI